MLNNSAAVASIATALFLVALKSWAAWRTDSTAMLGSLADSALDLVASIATLVGVWVAAQPADDDHRFGHGKAEALAAIFQVMLIALSAAGIAFRAIARLVSGARVEAANEGIAVSLVAIAATLLLLLWQRHVLRRTASLAIQTDHLHYQSDLLLNLAVIAALVLDYYLGMGGADPLFGLAIAGWLLWGAWRAAGDAIDDLMDREWPEDKRRELVNLVARHREILGMHDLRTRTSGMHDFVQFHIDVPAQLSVAEAHVIVDAIERDLKARFPGVEPLIHIDPHGHEDPAQAGEFGEEFSRLSRREHGPGKGARADTPDGCRPGIGPRSESGGEGR